MSPSVRGALKVVHVAVFAVYPVLFLYSHNLAEVRPQDLALPVAGALAGGLALLAALRLGMAGAGRRAALVTSAWVLLFFSYGHVYEALGGSLPILGRHRLLLPLWLALGLLALVVGRRASATVVERANRQANVVSLALLALLVVQLAFFQMRFARLEVGDRTHAGDPGSGPSGDREPPDIYFVVLDGYASNRTLRDVFGHSNADFTESLRARGFEVQDDGRSNYAHTFLSLAATFRMRYLDELAGLDPALARRTAFQWIEDSDVAHFLKRRGYTFVQIGTSWAVTGGNRFADVEIRCSNVNEFLTVLIPTTMLNPFKLRIRALLYDYADEILCGLEAIRGSVSRAGPQFVFAHLVSPHPPYVFRRDGSRFSDVQRYVGSWQPAERYVDQLVYLNREITKVVDSILRADSQAIVILQGDHGPATTFPDDEAWARPTDLQIRERLGILYAARLPEEGALPLEASTPVNTFRRLFRGQFGAPLPPLPDRSYFSSPETPLELTDVSEIWTRPTERTP